MVQEIQAGRAALKVLEGWGVDTIYGVPSGTLAAFMDVLGDQDAIQFIQVKHEEVGAMAAVMQKKFGGKLAVCVGSGGPGASHLINGLYDAWMDHIPVIAILGARPQKELNMDAFQEMNQNPMYDHISVFNVRVAYPEQLPKMLDEAARHALSGKGPAVLEVPTEFGWTKIPEDSFYSSGPSYQTPPAIPADEDQIAQAVQMLEAAKRPLIYAGFGTNHCGDLVEELAQRLKAPIVTTGISYDGFDYRKEFFLGSAFRVAWKPSNDALQEADTVLFIGCNVPFADTTKMLRNIKTFIQVDNNPQNLGKRHKMDLAILADSKDALEKMLEKVQDRPETAWYRANVKNRENWWNYMQKLEGKEKGDLQLYQVYHAINKYADPDAIYAVDVGNSTQTSVRHLHMTRKNMWRTSSIFATMGIGLPGAIGAKHTYPNRQVFNIVGDGAFAMSYQDVITCVRYHLPVINIVFANREYGFIKNKYEDTNKNNFGTEFPDVDYALIGKAQGAEVYTVRRIEEMDAVMKDAVAKNKAGATVVIDCKITSERPIPVEYIHLDPKLFSQEQIAAYRTKYEAEDLRPFREYLEEEGLESQWIR